VQSGDLQITPIAQNLRLHTVKISGLSGTGLGRRC
jgi:hypothetical protein